MIDYLLTNNHPHSDDHEEAVAPIDTELLRDSLQLVRRYIG